MRNLLPTVRIASTGPSPLAALSRRQRLRCLGGLALLCLLLIGGLTLRQASSTRDSSPEHHLTMLGAASLTADPNPVLTSGQLGSTTISWTTGSESSGQVFVRQDGLSE